MSHYFPPFASESDTSFAAAESVVPVVHRLRSYVLQLVDAAGINGVTCDEVEVIGNLSHQTASARVNELVNNGSIVDSGARRPTRSGRMARVMVLRKLVVS